MIFLKKCYVNTTAGLDCIAITPEVRYALRNSTIPAGLVTILLPEGGAGLVVVEPLPAVLEGLKSLWEGWRGGIAMEAKTTDLRKRQVAVIPRMLAAALGMSVHLPFHQGTLGIDPYMEIMVIDFDTLARRREIVIQVMGEPAEEEAPAGAPGGARPRGGRRG